VVPAWAEKPSSATLNQRWPIAAWTRPISTSSSSRIGPVRYAPHNRHEPGMRPSDARRGSRSPPAPRRR
jgi:hypothetical protein